MKPSNGSSDLARLLRRLLQVGFGAGGVLGVAIGVWMLSAPQNWFEIFPGAVADTGPVNIHMIRELGAYTCALGVLMLFALTNPMRFGGVTLVVTLVAYLSHAIIHVSDTVGGRLPAEHWVIDTPVVYVPAVAWLIMLWIWWAAQTDKYSQSELSVEEAAPEVVRL